MLGGTVAAIGGICSSSRFALELAAPPLGRRIHHGYAIRPLDIVA
jgi:hypothetical protein